MRDLIDRQAAIDAIEPTLKSILQGNSFKAITVIDKIRGLPSAEPEIIRCKDCENWDTTWQNDWMKDCHYCPLIDGIRNGDWYCADAERRTDG